MPNYRYHTSEYECRNSYGTRSRMTGQRSCGQQACGTSGGSREAVRNCCEVPGMNCREGGEMSCAVEEKYDVLSEMALAMAYVPWQMWRNIYDVEKGFCRGTIFEELDKPFRGMGGVR